MSSDILIHPYKVRPFFPMLTARNLSSIEIQGPIDVVSLVAKSILVKPNMVVELDQDEFFWMDSFSFLGVIENEVPLKADTVV